MQQEFAQFPVTSHTRHVGPGSTFVAVKGMQEDGVQYIAKALEAGAKKIVVEHDAVLAPELTAQIAAAGAQLVRVADARLALAELSAHAHGYPAKKLKIIGITGTKGKSTTTFLMAHMLRSLGHKTAFLSTVKNRILDTEYPTELTTQQPDYIHAFLARCVEAGVECVVMEVAAQALTLHRVATIEFSAVLFLNFSQEHGEFYASMDDYFAAKVKLITQLQPSASLILNARDARVRELSALAQSVFYFEPEQQVSSSLAGIAFTYQGVAYTCPALVGEFNVYNALAVLTTLDALGILTDAAVAGMQKFSGVPGRLDKYALPNGAVAFIDYAHNPLSFERVLSAMRPLTEHMIVLFGAGGDRDPARRPLMGALAVQFADLVILTTDNPRSEDPTVITAAIEAGIPAEHKHKVIIELDREKAIKLAYQHSRAGSTLMLLGKGPDEYQLIQGVKTPFSEREILRKL